MFKIVSKESIDWPVRVKVPQDGGQTKTYEFTGKLKLMPSSAIDAAINAEQQAGTDFLSTALVGWGADVQDENGNVIDYNDDNKAKLLDIPYIRAALWTAIREVNSGQAANRKN